MKDPLQIGFMCDVLWESYGTSFPEMIPLGAHIGKDTECPRKKVKKADTEKEEKVSTRIYNVMFPRAVLAARVEVNVGGYGGRKFKYGLIRLDPSSPVETNYTTNYTTVDVEAKPPPEDGETNYKFSAVVMDVNLNSKKQEDEKNSSALLWRALEHMKWQFKNGDQLTRFGVKQEVLSDGADEEEEEGPTTLHSAEVRAVQS